MPELVEVIRDAWRWRGLEPVEVLGSNAFGNVIVRAADGILWRIMPEEPSATPIAEDDAALRRVFADEEFRIDWEMLALVSEAQARLGPRGERCYCLKIPAVLGGAYDGDNMGLISLDELLGAAGDIARQIDGLPDGAHVRLRIME